MNTPCTRATVAAVLLVLGTGALASAHITPPVVLASDRDALTGLLAGARKFFVREIRLSPEQAGAIQRETGWRPDEDFYRFYVGRDDQGQLVASALFLTEFTIHGPVRVAVGMTPDGKVRGVTVVEVTEETYGWVKPLLDRQFTTQFAGRTSRDVLTVQPAAMPADPMTRFYGQVVASLIQRALVLYQTALRAGLK